MKHKSIVAGLVGGIIVFIVLPYLIILKNDSLGLYTLQSKTVAAFGLIFLLAGIGLFGYCTVMFKKKGKGTPAPIDPPKRLVYSGLYAHVRNPIYIGYVLVFFSTFLIFGRILLLFYALFASLLLHMYIVFFEEKTLQKRFGDSYKDYLKKVPRWIPSFNQKQDK